MVRTCQRKPSEFEFKFINDNVYGGIGLSEIEFQIINTDTFQRLRRIKQQGLTNYTFPGAEQTRFSHSLGVLHIMGLITKHLCQSGHLTWREQRILRLAALLHDIGHYPLSHLLESVYQSRSDGLLAERITTDPSPLVTFSRIPIDFAHHEQLGAQVLNKRSDIRSLLRGKRIDPDEVGQIITGKTVNVIHHQLMHSSLDADRMDYLLRDSNSAGVSFGAIDVGYLIRCLNKAKEKYDHPNRPTDFETLGVNIKGLHVLEHYLMARYFSYSQVTMHKTTSVFETLAKALAFFLAENGEIYPDYRSIIEIIPKPSFLEFDDNYFWKALKSSVATGMHPVYSKYRETLLNRRRIKVLFNEKIVSPKGVFDRPDTFYYKLKKYISSNLAEIAGFLGIDIKEIGCTEIPLNIENDERDIKGNESKYVEAPRVIENKESVLLVHTNNSLIKELFSKELRIFRVFYIDPFPDNRPLSDQLAEKVRKEVCRRIGP
jgi:HD superfamily phosphohydrolase